MKRNRSLTNDQFDVLLQAWNHHQDLRRDGASIPELAASRALLDAVRTAG